MALNEGTPPLTCGLPYEEFARLRNKTQLDRLNIEEATAVFDQLARDGFKIVKAE